MIIGGQVNDGEIKKNGQILIHRAEAELGREKF